MALLLAIETSTHNCSVALADDDKILALAEESSGQYIHSEKLHLFIQQLFEKTGLAPSDLTAVAVGKGPGSYTGLRIGVSAAKGFCYALQVPLVSLDGLQVLTDGFLKDRNLPEGEVVIPMLDARRMEVYCAIHDHRGKRKNEVEALIIEENSFGDIQVPRIHLIGDGAEKCREVLTGPRFIFHALKYPSAVDLVPGALRKLANGGTEDVAYFEPFYLKDFMAGKPKEML